MIFKVAVAQINSSAEISNNLQKVEKQIMEAAENGAQLIVFPENVEYIGTNYPENAQKVPGSITDFFESCAEKYHIYIHCGSITEKNTSERPFNSSLLFSRNGKLIGKYSKLHMFDISLDDGPSYKESDETSAGDEIVICDTKLGKIGMAICYDMRFPEIFKLMSRHGAQIICVPADFTMNTGKDHWKTLLCARAIENSCYVIAPGQIGEKPEFVAYGKSMIIDPWGNIIAMASDREEIIYAQIDLEYVDEIRRQIPSLHNVRNDVYQLVSDKVKVYREV